MYVHISDLSIRLSSLLGGLQVVDFSQATVVDRPFLDAVVTDPPYGIREGIKRVGTKPGREVTAVPEHL